MVNFSFNGKFIPKAMTADQWDQSDYVPEDGEIIVYKPDGIIHRSPRIKIGNGSTFAKILSFIDANPTYILKKQGSKIILEDNYGNKSDVEDFFGDDGELNLEGYVTVEYSEKTFATKAELEALEEKFLNLSYVAPKIASFTVNPKTVTSLDTQVQLSWSTEKGTNDYQVYLLCNDGIPKLKEKNDSEYFLASKSPYTLRVEDSNNGKSSERTIAVSLKEIFGYWGVAIEEIDTLEGALAVLTGEPTKDSKDDFTGDYTFVENSYLYFLFPNEPEYEEPQFWVGSLSGGFKKVKLKEESSTYTLYRTTFPQSSGITTITIK